MERDISIGVTLLSDSLERDLSETPSDLVVASLSLRQRLESGLKILDLVRWIVVPDELLLFPRLDIHVEHGSGPTTRYGELSDLTAESRQAGVWSTARERPK